MERACLNSLSMGAELAFDELSALLKSIVDREHPVIYIELIDCLEANDPWARRGSGSAKHLCK